MLPIHEPRVPPPGAPTEVHTQLGKRRAYLDVLRRHHVELVKRFLAADDGNVFTIDVFAVGVAMRSYHVVDAFLSLFDQWNVVAGAPILRLQLDNLTRLSYVVHAPRSDDIVNQVIEGVEFRRMKAPDGDKLLDWKLVDLASEYHPWLPPVYDKTSGWVHLSPLQAHMPWAVADRDEDGQPTLQGQFPLLPEEIPVSALEELLGAMTQATEKLFGYLEAWESRKGLPLGQARILGAEDPDSPDQC